MNDTKQDIYYVNLDEWCKTKEGQWVHIKDDKTHEFYDSFELAWSKSKGSNPFIKRILGPERRPFLSGLWF